MPPGGAAWGYLAVAGCLWGLDSAVVLGEVRGQKHNRDKTDADDGAVIEDV